MPMAKVNGVQLHYEISGSGPLLVLLHGWPQTLHCWRKVAPSLSEEYTVLAADLRGYGLSDKPVDGYDKRTMAADVSALVRGLGYSSAYVVGHDRGARVAHRWALDRPDEVARLAVLDIVPTREMWRADARVASGFWHWMFHLQPDLPELLAGKDIPGYLGYFFEHWTVQRDAFDAETIDTYVRAYSQPGALRASFDDYRAAFPDDSVEDDADFDDGKRLHMPLLALWGTRGLPRNFDVLATWKRYATDVRGETVPDCGHFIPEERPDVLLSWLRTFLGE